MINLSKIVASVKTFKVTKLVVATIIGVTITSGVTSVSAATSKPLNNKKAVVQTVKQLPKKKASIPVSKPQKKQVKPQPKPIQKRFNLSQFKRSLNLNQRKRKFNLSQFKRQGKRIFILYLFQYRDAFYKICIIKQKHYKQTEY